MKKKLIIFDYDGVIVDSMLTNYEIYKIICKKLEKEIPSTLKGFREIYGKTYKVLMKNLGIITPEEIKVVEEIYYTEVLKQNPLPFEGIKNVIEELYEKYDLVVLSATHIDEVIQKLEKHELLKYFQKVIGLEEKTSEHLNKAKEMINLINEMNIPKDDVLAIGDREIDYDFAKTAGLTKILIVDYGWGFDKNETPDRIQFDIKEPKDIIKAIKSINF